MLGSSKYTLNPSKFAPQLAHHFDALGLASGQCCGFPVHRQVTDPDQKQRSSRVMQVSTMVAAAGSSIVCKKRSAH